MWDPVRETRLKRALRKHIMYRLSQVVGGWSRAHYSSFLGPGLVKGLWIMEVTA